MTVEAVETHSGPNGVVEIVDTEQVEEQMVNGCALVDGPVAQPQPVDPGPPLYDVDLEKLHMDLYKGKYLTPQDFLEDIGKMVHNARVRMDEDPERLFKAQAMYTAAQVSIQEFDLQLRLECDRMAPRERKRREEHRKKKGKGKVQEDGIANGHGNPYPGGTRRSARRDGLQPEMPIMDPVQLERTLKRQRSDEAAADSQASDHSESRTTKRSRVILSDDDDHDPLDVVGPTSSQLRPQTVRFARVMEPIEPMRLLTPVRDQDPGAEQMVVDQPKRSVGFSPFLLNPIPAEDDVFTVNSPNGATGSQSVPSTTHSLPVDRQRLNFDQSSPSGTPVRTAGGSPELSRPSSPSPMIVERSPTPHPDFHVDEGQVSQFMALLHERSDGLTVEELEHLRATCLGCVWRHRSEWDRDALVQELCQILRDFRRDVDGDDT